MGRLSPPSAARAKAGFAWWRSVATAAAAGIVLLTAPWQMPALATVAEGRWSLWQIRAAWVPDFRRMTRAPILSERPAGLHEPGRRAE